MAGIRLPILDVLRTAHGTEIGFKTERIEDGEGRALRHVGADAADEPGRTKPPQCLHHHRIGPGQPHRLRHIVVEIVVVEIARGHAVEFRLAGLEPARFHDDPDKASRPVADHEPSLVERDGREAEFGQQPIRGSPEIREAVDQRAVQIEDQKGAPHRQGSAASHGFAI